MPLPSLRPVPFSAYLKQELFDALVFVPRSLSTSLLDTLDTSLHPFLPDLLNSLAADETAKTKLSFHVAPTLPTFSKRLVVSPLGPIDRDQDDVRRFADATRAGVLRAKSAGAVSPLVLLPPPQSHQYARAHEAALLSALAGLYEPLQSREHHGEKIETVQNLGFVVYEGQDGETLSKTVGALESGRRIGRDIGGGDPERMSPINAAKYIQEAFAGSAVAVQVVDDLTEIQSQYPLLHAVARASIAVPRHQPRVVRLQYQGSGEVEETLLFAGKGVTFDTGGADVKAGGIMAGMSRDKIGAASIVSFFKALSVLQPRGIKAVAELGFVRNSIGSDSYVADEIILSHGGKRVQVGNTDAEGRMVLADLLSHLRKKAIEEGFVDPKFFTCATLTGHAVRAVGPYTICLDNGPARAKRISETLKAAGEEWGDPIEISSLRREDFDFVAPKNTAYDILQSNNAASSATARGHQFPAAFLILASGLDAHGNNSEKPLPFTHVDIAGSGCEGDYQVSLVTATPTVAWSARFILPRLA